jgi:hypothetical protein
LQLAVFDRLESKKFEKKLQKITNFIPNPSIYIPTRLELIPHTISSHFSLPNSPFLLIFTSCLLGLIMRACVILHNMIIDDERDADLDETYETVDSTVGPSIYYNATPSLAARIQMDNEMTDTSMYTQLLNDLVEHVWGHNNH